MGSNGMDNLIIFCAKYLIFVIGLILVVVFAQMKSKTRWQFAAAVVMALVVATVLSKLASVLYYHPRPFVVQNIQPLVPHADDNGFPSDHALLATSLAVVIYFYRRRLGIAAGILALVVGIARVLADVHWPIDILGGLILGILAGWVGSSLAKKLLPIDKQAIFDKQND